jgi:OOP family OmpA-OmpF porin
VAPDVIFEFAVTKSNLKSIQFNAPKMVLGEFSNFLRAEEDEDGDGIPDFAGICPGTPRGDIVGQDGCPKGATVVQAAEKILYNDNDNRKIPTNAVENILFDFDRSEIMPQYCSVLDEFVNMLKQNRNVQVEIQGHTDNIGTAEYNQCLSEARARAVENYLVEKGVQKERLYPVGFGYVLSVSPLTLNLANSLKSMQKSI